MVKNEAEKSRTLRNFSIAFVLLLLVILALGYNRNVLKQRINAMIKADQELISKKNSGLQKLLNDNQVSLIEVNNRVKNNLELILSLLQFQAVHLNDKKAIKAITESHQRIFAMSIIHQKLYNSDNASVIEMREYVSELVSSLSDGFRSSSNVHFNLHIDKAKIGVSQAVSIGLILNEAITNCFKHAFPNSADDLITIVLKCSESGKIILTIEDNGRGLPSDFIIEKHNSSFGLLLIRGFVEDIDGTFEIFSAKGTTISIGFNKELQA